MQYSTQTTDSILAGPDKAERNQILKEMKKKVEVGRWLLEDFLGIKISIARKMVQSFTQSHLIDQILKDLRLDDENVTTKDTLAPSSSKILQHHTDSSEPFDGSFNYRSVHSLESLTSSRKVLEDVLDS